MTDAELEQGIRACSNPDSMRLIVEAFGGGDVDTIAANVADAIEDARARTPGLSSLVMLADRWALLRRSVPIPFAVNMSALRRCCSIAFGGDDDVQHYQSTTN